MDEHCYFQGGGNGKRKAEPLKRLGLWYFYALLSDPRTENKADVARLMNRLWVTSWWYPWKNQEDEERATEIKERS